jgi:RNA polymerase sigma factor (TIGR02999 family)
MGPSKEIEREITQWLTDWESGNEVDVRKLPEFVYGQIRRLAVRRFAGERKDHTLQPTALANEVYLRLLNMRNVNWQGKAQFMGLVAKMMRHILVDHARRRRARIPKASFEEVRVQLPAEGLRLDDVAAVHLALEKLEEVDERLGRIVNLRYFAGLTVAQVAELLNTSTATVERDWDRAKRFLRYELAGRGDDR